MCELFVNPQITGIYGSDSSSDDEEIIEFIVHLGRPRKIARHQVRRDHFHYWDDNEFFRRFRLSKDAVVNLLEIINDDIKHLTNWNHALTSMEMLLLTLRFFATGSFLIDVGDFSSIHKTTAGKIIFRVTQSIANLRNIYIKFPLIKHQLQREFYKIARFPRVIGALDCTHVKIKSPGGQNAEIYRNRKQFFSINVQTICDPHLKIMNVVARWPGSVHDSTIFNNSQICRNFENGHFDNAILLGDAGYPTKSYLLTPLSQTNTRGENLYNEAQIRTRNPIERCYGVWKKRFPVLSNGINLNIDKVQWIIVATAVLHNIAIENNEAEPPALTAEEQRNFEVANIEPVEYIQEGNVNIIRNEMVNYFSNI